MGKEDDNDDNTHLVAAKNNDDDAWMESLKSFEGVLRVNLTIHPRRTSPCRSYR